jgi:hypothetical protein
MSHIFYLPNECYLVSTKVGIELNLADKICKVKMREKNEWIYFRFSKQTDSVFGGFRLQQDQYNNKKFYEINKFREITNDELFSKGRKLFVYN